jgi:hypothetical protein
MNVIPAAIARVFDHFAVDERTNYDYIERNLVRLIDRVEVSADQLSIAVSTTPTDLTTLTFTHTQELGHWYRYIFKGEVIATVADGTFVFVISDSVPTALDRYTDACLTTAPRTCTLIYEEEALIKAQVTRKMQLAKLSGTGTIGLTASSIRKASFTIEDLGFRKGV